MVAAVRSSSVQDTPTSSSVAVTVPAGAAIGDIMVAIAALDSISAAISAPDVSWTQLDQQTISAPDGQTAAVFWKRLTAADTGTYTFTTTVSTQDFSVAVTCISGADGTVPPVIGAITTNTTNNSSPISLTATGITAVANDVVLMLATIDTSPGKWAPLTWTPPSGFTTGPATTVQTVYTPVYTAYLAGASAGATGTETAVGTAAGKTGGWITWLVRVPSATVAVDYLFENDWSMGVAGVAPSAANTAGSVAGSTTSGNDAITSVTNASATETFDATWSHRNRFCSILLAFPSGAAGYLVCTLRTPSSTNTRIVYRGYYRVPAGQTIAVQRVLELRNTGGSLTASMSISSTSKWSIVDSAGTISNTGVTPVAGTEYRIEVAQTVGTSTSNSVLEIAIYLGDSMTPVEAPTVVSNANCGTTIPATFRIGASSTNGSGQTNLVNVGPVRVAELATGYLGPARPGKSLRVELSDGLGGTTLGYLTWKDSNGVEQAIASVEVQP